MANPPRISRTWHRQSFYITTDPRAIPLDELNALFAQPDFTWGKPLPLPQLQKLLDSSICFALFAFDPQPLPSTSPSSSAFTPPPPSPRPSHLIGLGRWITDHVTVVYVNDIYIDAAYRAQGLAKWMLGCMNDQLSQMPDLRGTILIVEKGSHTETLYRRHFGMGDLAEADVLLDRKGPGAAN